MDFLPASEKMTIEAGEIHIWRSFIEASSPIGPTGLELLSPDEIGRAERYQTADNRNYFIQQRALLRYILSRYLDCDPGDIVFSYSIKGRPSLDPTRYQQPIYFNLSHSGQIVLYAIAYDMVIGIDVEYMRENVDIKAVAKRYFTANEVDYLECLPQDQQRSRFFEMWVGKEAYIKARGEGLGLSLSSFEILPTEDQEEMIIPLKEDSSGLVWKVTPLAPYPQYTAAVAAPVGNWHWQGYDVTPKILQK